jgi:hypothetical protein
MLKRKEQALSRSAKNRANGLRRGMGRKLGTVAVSALAVFALTKAFVEPADAQSLKKVAGTVEAANKDGAAFQDQVDKLHTDATNLLGEYEAVLQQSEALTAYNAQLAKLVESQNAELASLTDQIGRVTVVSRALTPMMLNMIDALGEFIELDMPFLPDERRARVARLKKLMDQADVSESEKYRQIIEAYQIETDYGRTLELYKGEIELDGAERTVDFLRIGRVALIFQSLDTEIVGHFNPKTKAYEVLDTSHRAAIRYGMRVVGKQRAPDDLLNVPLLAGLSDAGEK